MWFFSRCYWLLSVCTSSSECVWFQFLILYRKITTHAAHPVCTIIHILNYFIIWWFFFSFFERHAKCSKFEQQTHTRMKYTFFLFWIFISSSFSPSMIIVSLLLLLAVLCCKKMYLTLFLQIYYFCMKSRGRTSGQSWARVFASLLISFHLSFVWNFRRSFAQSFYLKTCTHFHSVKEKER